ncbi:hypothetical protein LSAT2_010248, partial [Lamellibrachia satsuma]
MKWFAVFALCLVVGASALPYDRRRVSSSDDRMSHGDLISQVDGIVQRDGRSVENIDINEGTKDEIIHRDRRSEDESNNKEGNEDDSSSHGRKKRDADITEVNSDNKDDNGNISLLSRKRRGWYWDWFRDDDDDNKSDDKDDKDDKDDDDDDDDD